MSRVSSVRPVDQTIFDPVRDDCLRAAVASVAGFPISEVPNFMDIRAFSDDHSWRIPLWNFLRSRGYGLELVVPPRRVRSQCVAVGPSPRGTGVHAVVWSYWLDDGGVPGCGRRSGVVHDPHPSRQGLAGDPTMLILIKKPKPVAVAGVR